MPDVVQSRRPGAGDGTKGPPVKEEGGEGNTGSTPAEPMDINYEHGVEIPVEKARVLKGLFWCILILVDLIVY